AFGYAIKANTVAVVTDGSAVLGLGDIGPEAAMAVMEAKCALFKAFGSVDAFPICLDTTDPDDVVDTAKALAPDCGGLYLDGLSGPGVLEAKDLERMNDDAFVFAMDNPNPEVKPEDAAPYVRVMATGRSDYPNQINNVLAFPGIFRGAFEVRAPKITEEMKMAAAQGIASVVSDEELREDYIIPSVFNDDVCPAVSRAVAEEAQREGMARAGAAFAPSA